MSDESIMQRLRIAIQAKGGTDDTLGILDTKEGEGLVNSFAEQLVKIEFNTRTVFPVIIDYDLTLEQMIAECTCGYVNPKITAVNFSIMGSGIVEEEIILVHFNRYINSGDAIVELKKIGLDPARIEHVLAFSKKYPKAQCCYPVVFLGSCMPDGSRDILYLYRSGSQRRLGLNYFDIDWYSHCRFAAVRTTS